MGEKKIKNYEELVDTNFLMEKIGFSRNFWSEARIKYKLPYFKLGNKVKYKLSEVDRWLKERKVNG